MLRKKGKQEGLIIKGKGRLQTSWSHPAFKGSITFLCSSACSQGWITRLLQNFKLLAVIFTLPLLSLLIHKVSRLKANLSTTSNSHNEPGTAGWGLS